MARESRLGALLQAAAQDQDAEERERAYEELSRLLMILARAAMSRRARNNRDSIDICQSVARSFVAEIRGGQVAFDSEAALIAYLRRAVHSKLADLARRDGAAKRTAPDPELLQRIRAQDRDESSPSSIITLEEEAARMRENLGEDDRQLVDLRRRGVSWTVIAEQLSISPEAARKRWSRLQKAGCERIRRG